MTAVTPVTTSDFSPEGPNDFGFACNDITFFDRLLCVEIVPELLILHTMARDA
ncbi:hypothetical protein Hdeb2414_s0004g00146281 [Helianthus debilis subsp. tardiflorus]